MQRPTCKKTFFYGIAGLVLLTMPGHAADLTETVADTGPATVSDNSLLTGGVLGIGLAYIDHEDDEVDISDPDTQLIGGHGAVSIPFMDRYSIQLDALGEHTLDKTGDDDQTIGNLMLGAHASYRDPSMYLVGLFGGGGWSWDNGDDDDGAIPFYFLGAEAQVYWNNFTGYGQVGYLDAEDFYLEVVEKAWFGRAVASYYFGPNTKLAGEVSYVSGDRKNNTPGGPGELDVFGWGARLQHVFDAPMLPAPAAVSLAYNGFDYRATDESDSPMVHEFRIGFDILLGSNTLIDNDRRAVALDLPPINRWVSTSANEIE